MDDMDGMPRRLVLGTAIALPLVALAERVGSAVENVPATGPAATSTTAAGTRGPAGPSPTGVPGKWRIVLNDDFEGTSLDSSRWNTQYPWGEDNNGDGSENCYLPSNVTLDGQGNLVLTGQRGEVQGTGSAGESKSWPYSSGQVNTFGKFSLTHGVLEVRAQVPAGLGTWPAFWSLPANGSWPPEVDVMEVYGTDPGTLDMTYLWGSEQTPKQKDRKTTLEGGEAFSSDFHVFGCAITKRAITWYLDGVKQWSFTRADKIAQLRPLYVVCNLAIGGAGGDPDGTPMPVQYVVDYIRAWKAA
jgi:beta-glucanase (GH16 family)